MLLFLHQLPAEVPDSNVIPLICFLSSFLFFSSTLNITVCHCLPLVPTLGHYLAQRKVALGWMRDEQIEVNNVSSGHHADRLSKGESVSKVKDGNCINFLIWLEEIRQRLMSLLNQIGSLTDISLKLLCLEPLTMQVSGDSAQRNWACPS